MSQEIEIEMPLDGDLRLFSLKTPSLSEAPLAAARSIFTSSAEPAEADPPSPTPAAEAYGGQEATVDTLFAFIPAVPDGAFCEGG